MKKTLFIALSLPLAFATVPLAALPGVTRQLEDASGEYVFYRDATFEREAYVGFVFYDDSTYGARFYAPAVANKKAPRAAKDIQLYVTVDATQPHLELTGERIASAVTAEDTDLVNYLHDLLYELTARRQKAGEVSSTVSVTQDFEQFGGDVALDFNALVPIFNLQTIRSIDGTVLFQVVTTGILSASDADGSTDSSFTDFTGFPMRLQDKAHTFKPSKKTTAIPFSYATDSGATQSVTLDAQWTQFADNMFFLEKNAALLTFDTVPATDDGALDVPQLTRALIRTTRSSYTDWTKLSITKDGNRTYIRFPVYDKNSNTLMQSCKLIDELADGGVAFLILTVYDSAYTAKNRAYFNAVLDSYTVH